MHSCPQHKYVQYILGTTTTEMTCFARGYVHFINLIFMLLSRTEHVLCDICVLRFGYILLW